MKEISNDLVRYEELGLISPDGKQEIETLMSQLIARGALAESRSSEYIDGKRYVKIMPQFSTEIRKKLGKDWLIYDIYPFSVAELMEHPDFREVLGVVSAKTSVKTIVPPQTQIAFKPESLAIPKSGKKMPIEHKKLMPEYSKSLQTLYETDNIAVIMWPGLASALIQAESRFQRENGKKLIVGDKGKPLYLRIMDRDFGYMMGEVGRGKPEHNLNIANWLEGGSDEAVSAPSILVPVGPLVS